MFKTFFTTQDFFLRLPIMLHLPIKFNFLPLSQYFSTDLKFEYFFVNVAFILLFIAVLLYWFDFSDTKSASKKVKNICMIGANVSLTFLLMIRWWESGHFPLSNLYESLIGLSWGFTAVHLIVTFDQTHRMSRVVSDKSCESNQFSSSSVGTTHPESGQVILSVVPTGSGGILFSGAVTKSTTLLWADKPEPMLSSLNDKIGTITAPTALLTSVFATFFLPEDMLRVTTLIPALKSNWLTMHVTLMILSYAFLLIGSLLSMAYCAYRFSINFNPKNLTGAKHLNHISKTGLLQWLDFFVPSKLQHINKTDSTKDHTQKVWFTKQPLESSSAMSSGIMPSSCERSEQSFWSSIPAVKQEGLKQQSLPKDEAQNPLPQNQYLVSSENAITTIVSPKNNSHATSTPHISRNADQQLQVQSDICIWLNTTSYRILGLGFPLLTIGILSGAVWANEAWGSYWSWDPKETWALITWLVFAIYFHSRYNRSSDNSPVPASIASIGFFVIWVCYLGVNLLGTGLHSYGWFGKL